MRQRVGGVLPALLIAVIVIGLSVLLLRARSSSEAAQVVYAPAPVGDETAERLTPVLSAAQLPESDGGPVLVALVRDPASQRYYDDSSRYDRSLDGWARALEEIGARVERVTPDQLSTHPGGVIVVPAAPCLSAATRAAMLEAGSRGRGVIFTGMTGTRNQGCRAIGYGLLASLTGASRADTLSSSIQPFVTLPAGSPLSLDIPPGARIELMPAPHVAVRVAGRDGYYSDRDLNPSIAADDLMDGAIVHEVSSGRRVAYLGFELETVVGRPWEIGILELIIRNAVALAAGIPIASLDPWPAGFTAAAVIAQDVEDEFVNAQHAIDSLEAADAPGTFFLVSDLAGEHPELVAAMASVGEIGTHSESHIAFGGPVEAQRSRLERTQEQLTERAGAPIEGLRPPDDRFDARTLAAWRPAGGSYVFGATNGRSASPELVEVDGDPFVLIGRTADDDFLTVRRAGITDTDRLASDQLAAFAKSRALGGLYIMSYHSNMMARPATAPAVGTIARALRSDTDVWLTTMGQVADWWRVRHAAEVAVERAGADTVVLRIRNGADRDIQASSAMLTLPRGARVTESSGGTLLPAVAGTARVPVPRLAPGQVFVTHLTLAGGADAR